MNKVACYLNVYSLKCTKNVPTLQRNFFIFSQLLLVLRTELTRFNL